MPRQSKQQRQDRCHQWSTRPDPQSLQLWTLFSLEICFVLLDFEKWGNFWRTDGQHERKQRSLPALTVGRSSGSKYFEKKGSLATTRMYLRAFYPLETYSITCKTNSMLLLNWIKLRSVLALDRGRRRKPADYTKS